MGERFDPVVPFAEELFHGIVGGAAKGHLAESERALEQYDYRSGGHCPYGHFPWRCGPCFDLPHGTVHAVAVEEWKAHATTVVRYPYPGRK